MPSIPLATLDPASMLAAINALTAAFQLLSGQQPARPQGTGQDGQPGAPGQDAKKGDWQETSRSVGTIRVTNPKDSTQFVDVQVINKLVMTDQATGKTWVWTR
jgi:hypothetical protein